MAPLYLNLIHMSSPYADHIYGDAFGLAASGRLDG